MKFIQIRRQPSTNSKNVSYFCAKLTKSSRIIRTPDLEEIPIKVHRISQSELWTKIEQIIMRNRSSQSELQKQLENLVKKEQLFPKWLLSKTQEIVSKYENYSNSILWPSINWQLIWICDLCLTELSNDVESFL